MPGIVGIVGQKPAAECERLVAAMLASMAHERFYESGTCFVPEMGVYAGWTAHQGSFAARQSVRSGVTELLLILSGECVAEPDTPLSGGNARNPSEWQESIETEYAKVGDQIITRLNGVFSGLLIDRSQKRTLLFNDRYGIERIYVHETDDTIYFASEAKALLRIVPDVRAFDDDALSDFLAFGCTLNWQTLFRGVRLLEGGSLWCFQHGERQKKHYFVPEEWQSQPPLTAEIFEREFQATLQRIVPRYVDSASATGISLTGGLDTRMIMACLRNNHGKPPICYTFAGSTDDTLDARLAARVAAACGLEHNVLRIGADFLTDYRSYVDRTVYATDGCSGAVGAHEIYINAKARQLAPVRLTGNFGSEVLRSVSTFKSIGLSPDLLQSDLGRMVVESGRKMLAESYHPVTFSAFREVPWSQCGSLAASRSQVTLRTPYLDNAIVALAFRAPIRSRQSPALALHLVKNSRPDLSTIPTDLGFGGEDPRLIQIMRQVLARVTFKLDYFHMEGLPPWLASLDPILGGLSKTGILGLHKFLPYRNWYRRDLAGYVSEVLTDAQTSRLPYWNRTFLRSMARDHASGRKNYVREINAVLTLEAAERLLIRNTSA